MAPVTFPMMLAIVYPSAKLGQVTGQRLFAVLRKNYSSKVLYPTLTVSPKRPENSDITSLMIRSCAAGSANATLYRYGFLMPSDLAGR
jgi:hypothetical protein